MKSVVAYSLKILFTALAVFLLFSALFFTLTAQAQPTPHINYQGKLTDAVGVAVPDGTYNMRFWLLQSTGQATTSAIWTESLTGTDKVQVTNGLFSVMLGSTSALTAVDFNQALYLGVEIGGSTTPAWDGEMSPRKPLGTVPAAFESFQLGGVASSSFVRSDQADTMAATEASTLLTINQSGAGDILNLLDGGTEVFTVLDGGNVGIGTTTPDALLTVAGDINIDDVSSGLSIMGTRVFYSSTTNDSIAIGELAGNTFNSGTAGNVALGSEAGRYASTTFSDYNNFIGYQAGYNNTSNSNNIFGQQAGFSNTGDNNNIFGQQAGYGNTGDDSNIFGWQAGMSNLGDTNNLFGRQAGQNNTGSNNNSFGSTAGFNNTGSYNNLIGFSAGRDNTGNLNNLFGYWAGYSNTGNYNEMIGYQTGRYLQSTSTVAIGGQALLGPGSTYISLNNVALGYRAGYVSDDGSGNNILIGYQAADNLTTGNNNIIIGYDIDNTTATADNVLNIGNLIFGTGVDGAGTAYSSGNIGIGTSSPYAKLSVVGDIYASSTGTSTLTGILNVGDYYALDGEKVIYGNGTYIGVGYSNTAAVGGTAIGSNNTADQTITTAIGSANNATNFFASAIGYLNNSTGINGVSIGYGNDATSTSAVAIGTANDAGGSSGSSVAMGLNNSSQGLYSSALGYSNKAYGSFSTAVGAANEATQSYASAFGYNNDVTNSFSTAIGFSNTVSGASATAIGNSITNTISSSVMIGPSDSAKLTILSTGNVGIGTTSPYAKLSVVGDGVITGTLTASDITATGTITTLEDATNTFAGNLDINGTATSTFANGITLEGGCLQVGGTCLQSAGDTSIVVAASDTDTTLAAYADYVADGTNDEVQIQAAIDAVSTMGGGTVYLLEGTFIVSPTAAVVIDMKSNVTLQGQGQNATIIKLADSTNASSYIIQATSESYVTIRDLQVDGNKANNLTAGNYYGIYFSGTGSSTIENTYVHDVQDNGIFYSSNSANNTITNNVTNNNASGIYFFSSVNNTITNNTANSNTTTGIYFDSSSNNTITNNTANSNTTTGIYLLSSLDNTITANLANSNGYAGLHLNSSLNNTITSNTSNNNTILGIYFTNASDKNNITGNTFNSNGYGVQFFTGSQNNTFTGNTINDTRYNGVWLRGSPNNSIVGNSLSGNGHAGSYASIYASDFIGVYSSDNVISSNNISATGTDALIQIGSGSNRNVITGNVYTNPDTTTYVSDAGTDTRYNEWDRTTITTDDERGYNLFSIRGSSSVALASSTQLGTGDIFALNNTSGNVLTVTNGGNVGIGTTTAGTGLAVSGNFGGSYVGGYPAAMLLEVDDYNAWNLVYGNKVAGQANYLANYMGNDGNLYFGNSANLGILTLRNEPTGTNAVGINLGDAAEPSRDLTVSSDRALGNNQTAIVNIAGGTNTIGTFPNTTVAALLNFGILDNSGTGAGTLLNIASIQSTPAATGGATGGNLEFRTGAAGASTRMVIDVNGNVGIGTTSPYAKLSVAGQVVGSYFTATSTTASSTFKGLTATGLSLGNVTSSLLKANGSGYVTAAVAGTDYENPLTFNNGLTRTTNNIALGGALTADTSINANAANKLTLTSTLSSGARTAYPMIISQANDATYNNSVGLLQLSNSDTGSTAALLNITQAATAGTGINFTSLTGGNSITVANTTGTALNANTVTTGSGLTATALTTGAAVSAAIPNGATTASALRVTTAATGISADYSGAIINIAPTRTMTAAATRNNSGNFLLLNRTNVTNGASSILNVSGALASLQSTCTQTQGTCNDSSNILSLTQSYAAATGNVFTVAGAGTGNLATLTATNASANGMSITTQSSSASQYVLNLTSNAGATNVLRALANGNVGIGTTSPYAKLSVVGDGVITGNLDVQGTGTSTFGGGIQTAGALDVNGTATSTFANGIQLSAGCFKDAAGNCMSGAIPETNSLETTITGIADTEIFIGNGADSGTFAAISGDATLANTGALTLAATNANLTTLANLTTVGTIGTGVWQGTDIASQYISTTSLNIAIADTTGILDVTRGGTGLSTFGGANTILYTTAADTLAANNNFVFDGNYLGLGTTTPWALLTVGSSTPLALLAADYYNSAYISGLLEVGGTGTSTFAGPVKASCFTTDGVNCITGAGGSGTVNSSTQGYLAYYAANGTAVSGTSSVFIDTNGNIGIGTTTPQEKLHLSGGSFLQEVATTSMSHVGSISSLSVGVNTPIIRYPYAYLAQDQLQIIDISNPANPELVSTLNWSGGGNAGADIEGDYLYVADQTTNQLRVINIANANNPTQVGVLTLNDPMDMVAQGNYVYVTDNGTDALRVIDVSDPTNPVEVASVGINTSPQHFTVAGDYAYITDAGAGGMDVVDISDPYNPVVVANTSIGQYVKGIDVVGNYAYLADRTAGQVLVVDVEDPTTPSTVGTVNVDANVYDIAVSGKYAYTVGLTGEDLEVIDISSSTNPVVRDSLYFDLGADEQLSGVAVSGRYAYVYDLTTLTLSIVDVTGIEVTSALVHSLEAGSLDVREDAMINGLLSVKGSISAGRAIYGNAGGAFSLATSSTISQSALSGVVADGNTAGVANVLTLNHSAYSGAAGDGIGTGLLFEAEDSAGAATSTAQIASIFTDVTAATPASALAFSTKNTSGSLTERMRLSAAGYLGLGTTSPYAKLSVAGTAGQTNPLFQVASSSNSSYLTVTSDGNVGIGSTTPNSKLSIVGGSGAHTLSVIRPSDINFQAIYADAPDPDTTFGATYAGLYLANTDQTNNNFSRFNFGDGDETAAASIGTHLTNHAADYGEMVFYTRGTDGFVERMRIDEYNLEMPDAGNTLWFSGTNGGGNEGVQYSDSGGAARYGLVFPGSDVVALANRATNGTVQIRANTTAGTGGEVTVATYEDDKITFLTNGGNVGIGTTTPTALLTIGSSTPLSLLAADYYNSAYISGMLEVGGTGTSTFLGGISIGNGAFQVAADGGITSISSLEIGNLSFEEDAGLVSWTNLSVSASVATGTVESYVAELDGNPMITVYGKADGQGGVSSTSVGIGTTTPTALLTIGVNTPATLTAADYTDALFVSGQTEIQGTTTIGVGGTSQRASLHVGYGGICVDNDGTCTATTTGRISSVSQYTGNSDLAETYFSSTDLEPGDVVSLVNELTVNRAAGTSTIIGVVSSKPGILLGFDDKSLTEGEKSYPIALAGRIPVKLSTENGPITRGDHLMLSSLPGVAMKATGTGATIGIALEDFDGERMYSDTYINQIVDDLGTTTEAEIEDMEEDLEETDSDTETLADGTDVKIGKVVMYIDLNYRWLDSEMLASINEVMEADVSELNALMETTAAEEGTAYGTMATVIKAVTTLWNKVTGIEARLELLEAENAALKDRVEQIESLSNIDSPQTTGGGGTTPPPDPDPTPDPVATSTSTTTDPVEDETASTTPPSEEPPVEEVVPDEPEPPVEEPAVVEEPAPEEEVIVTEETTPEPEATEPVVVEPPAETEPAA